MSRTRGTWNTKGMWAAGVALAAVVGLTGYAMLNGDDDSGAAAGKGSVPSSAPSSFAGAVPTYQAPDDWTEPERWAALPRGALTDIRGSRIGFPHTTEGAVAMMAAANTTDIEANRSNVDEQLRIYYSYIAKADQSSQYVEQVKSQSQQTDKSLHKEMGVSPGQALPSGAYVRSNVVGFKVIEKSSDEVSVWLLFRVTQKNGETAKEKSSYARLVNGAVWEDGDWKLSVDVTARALKKAKTLTAPGMGAPGDAKFNDYGWTAIREAS
ncbi:hypothetical protein ACFOOM_04640 [Streptomyces echinoruber]|uniref:DUF8175 domain-containing protein n=1 Tax=Streptomyces echinoruber TaxID=68898 RepID=A0A918S0T6_9ACTN|nr:hypothetical protein [Streptomyces echinoruber]GHA18974.1 hypothetical protein GCM10010389_66040 [Streptomyces echinoruber]